VLNPIQARPVLQNLLFAQSFEDPEIDRCALQIRPEHTVLCITSGGCNVLSLLLDAPARLIALDMNPTQNAMLQLKMAGIRGLTYDDYLELLGVRASERRLEIYNRISGIPFWDTHPKLIERGALHAGRFEQYLGYFRHLLRLCQGQDRIEQLILPRDRGGRERFYTEVWNTPQWRSLFRFFFSRPVLGRLGLDPKFFTFVRSEQTFGDVFLRRVRHALVELPVHDNYFAEYILFGTYRRVFPSYLKRENFPRLQKLVDRIEVVTEEVEEFLASLPDNTIDRIDFSNIFEWIDEANCERLLRETVRVCRPGARITYRNLLVHRERPESMAAQIRSDPLAKELLLQDRAFVYSNFVVEEIVKETACPYSPARHFASIYSR
jgi:S-adenosylmethionine-diacylglycerol 3-amino-3-carboxypropyl transferase